MRKPPSPEVCFWPNKEKKSGPGEEKCVTTFGSFGPYTLQQTPSPPISLLPPYSQWKEIHHGYKDVITPRIINDICPFFPSSIMRSRFGAFSRLTWFHGHWITTLLAFPHIERKMVYLHYSFSVLQSYLIINIIIIIIILRLSLPYSERWTNFIIGFITNVNAESASHGFVLRLNKKRDSKRDRKS